MSKRETLARRRPAGALGGVGTLGRTEAVPPHHRVQADPGAHQGIGNADAIQESGCQGEKGIVEWVTRESLLSTGPRAFPRNFRALLILLASLFQEMETSACGLSSVLTVFDWLGIVPAKGHLAKT